MTTPDHRAKIEQLLADYVWGLCCKECDGGGWDYTQHQICPICQGRGVHSWEYGDAIRQLDKAYLAAILALPEMQDEAIKAEPELGNLNEIALSIRNNLRNELRTALTRELGEEK